MPIKYKALVVLVAFSTIAMGLYLLFVVRLFMGDRLAYVFDSSRIVSSSLSAQVKLEIDSWKSELAPIVQEVSPRSGKVGKIGSRLFHESKRLDALWIYRLAPSGHYVQSDQLLRPNIAALNIPALALKFPALIKSTSINGLALTAIDLSANDQYGCQAAHWCRPVILMSELEGNRISPNHKIAITMLRADSLVKIFGQAFTNRAYLLSPSGKAILGAHPLVRGSVIDFSTWPFFRKVKLEGIAEGAEQTNSSGNIPMLISYSQLGIGNLMVISMVKKSIALRGMHILFMKSILLFIALFSYTVIVALFLADRSTRTLRDLIEASSKVLAGDFTVRVRDIPQNEIGRIAEGFNSLMTRVDTKR